MNDVTLPIPELTGPDYFDIVAARNAFEMGEPVRFPPFDVAFVPRLGLTLCLNMQRDPIQNSLRRGKFFEEGELDLLLEHVKDGAHIIDIGSNIGNHALYFATRLKAARVVVVEPNPLALAPLVANILVNRLGGIIDIAALGVGLSDKSEAGFGMKRHDRNLGATRMFAGQGDLVVHAGDDLFEDETPHLIKIDVEGMEMKVLSGLERTIETHRPLLFIEVDDEHDKAFADWRESHRYDVLHETRHSHKNCNYILRPAESAGA
jgi:FkbM family methyltransferase